MVIRVYNRQVSYHLHLSCVVECVLNANSDLTLEGFLPQHVLEDIITDRDAFSSSTTPSNDEEALDCYMPLETQTVRDTCVTVRGVYNELNHAMKS